MTGNYEPGRFRPLPFLSNPNVQTVLGHLLSGGQPEFPSSERLAGLVDGDRLVLHDSIPPSWRPGRPVVLLVHGMGGSHRSGPVARTAVRLWRRGARVVRVDLRGCGRGAALAHRLYNGGCSEDIRSALSAVRSWSPESPLVLVGFSLGGNIVLKLAAEAAIRPVAALARVLALGPAIDLGAAALRISLPQNRIYERHFIQCLVGQVRHLEKFHPNDFGTRFRRHLSMRDFDEQYTAPRGGFADAQDYYSRSSSAPLIPQIAVPTLLVTARDDPFIPVEPFEGLRVPGHIEIRIEQHGGHLGFIGRDGDGSIRWAESLAADWATRI